ncbi:MAG: hypothetical protein KKA19_08265 [Candidatus Margulisbacteria bacterium]|nr:hypothetical protein [Candidatus Margulisiibacteriota bacterium]
MAAPEEAMSVSEGEVWQRRNRTGKIFYLEKYISTKNLRAHPLKFR